MFSGLSTLHRGQSTSGKRQESLVLDLSQANKGTPTGAGSKISPGFRTSESSSVSWQNQGSVTPAASPRFNDPVQSDVLIEVANPKGELQNVLHLHSQVLREQSDYFFNTLGKRGLLRESSGSDGARTTFTIHTSRHVPDPNIYVTVFQLFYQEEELIAEDIVCIGSVWKVLLILVVAAELQFHACTTACVDYLESVPWSDQELEDIVRLVPQLDRLQDAQPVLDRLPVRTWDEDSISDALRMLLIRAVAFHDGTGAAAIAPGLARHGGGGIALSTVPSGGMEGGEGVSTTSAPSEGAEKGGSGNASSASAVPSENPASSQGLQSGSSRPAQASMVPGSKGLLEVRPVPGSLECRDAACSILRNHEGPLLPLRTKKMLLRETFGDLLQVLWSEQKERSGQEGREGAKKKEERGKDRLQRGQGGEEEEEEDGEDDDDEEEEDTKRDDGREEIEGKQAGQEEPAVGRDGGGGRLGFEGVGQGVARASSTEAFDVSPVMLESVFGKQGALTWITAVMIEFSMADEVFKWLASDKDFLSQVLAMYRKPTPTTGAAAASSAAQAHTQHTAQEALSVDEGLLSAPSSHLWIVRSSLLGLAAAILSKRLVVNPKLRSTFVRTWVPVMAEICTTGDSGQALIYRFPLTEEEKAIILSAYNELVLTLPAADQRSIFQLWYLKLSFNAPMSTSVAESLPQDTGNSSSREEGAGRRVQTGDATRGEEVGTREVVAPPFWFTLSPAYIRWLMRLGTLCGTPGGDY